MSEEKKEAPAPAQGKSKLVIALVAINTVVILGAGAAIYFLALRPAASAHAQEPAHEAEPANLGPLLEVEPMVVNLDEPEAPRFARVALQLELESDEARERVEARMVPIRSAVILYISGLHTADLSGREHREAFLEQVRSSANHVLGGELIRHVYLVDLVVQ